MASGGRPAVGFPDSKASKRFSVCRGSKPDVWAFAGSDPIATDVSNTGITRACRSLRGFVRAATLQNGTQYDKDQPSSSMTLIDFYGQRTVNGSPIITDRDSLSVETFPLFLKALAARRRVP